MTPVPQDFNDPAYGHLKTEIIDMLNGPLSSVQLSAESAIAKIRHHSSAEWGYSDELVKSMPEFIAYTLSHAPEKPASAPLDLVIPPEKEEVKLDESQKSIDKK